MMVENLVWWICLIFTAAWAGGIATATLGYLAAPEPFDTKKFLTSVIKSFIGAAGITYTIYAAGVTELVFTLITAFLSGAGVEAGIKRITNVINNKKPDAGGT